VAKSSSKDFLKIGLTGGIASGKSTVAGLFRSHGIPVLDADQLVRDLSTPGGLAHDSILKHFGTADRAELRARIFGDPRERRALEAILHPLVRSESERLMSVYQSQGVPGVIYEAALLVEAGRAADFDEVIVVVAPEDVRVSRLMNRDGSTREQAMSILGAQLSDEERVRQATRVINNAGDRSALEREVSLLLNELWPGLKK
jgi:dephospho-CoA kinase